MQMGKKVVVIAGVSGVTSTMVMELVKNGYAVECTESGYAALERIGCRRAPCDALVITPAVLDILPGVMLGEVVEMTGAPRAKVPTVLVTDDQYAPQARSVAYARNNVAAITKALGEVLASHGT